jgi:3-oxoacyl-[acyl-carrier-protein] synthase-1
MILDRNQCTPFDADRKGLNLGEGAAFLVLESEESVLKNGSKILAELKGFSNTNDAYHQTASSPDGYGPYLAMKFAMEMANLNPQDIDYVNVHGTGTPNNDLSEGLALKRFFGEKIPKFSSTKAYTGHTLAASGALEAVYSVLAIQNNVIFPNLFFKNAIPELNYSPETNFIENFQVNNVLSNSFGFGGNDSSLIFSKV